MLLVTGPVSKHMAIALKRTYDATPEPKLVVAVGDCGCTGGIFGESYASLGRVANVIPVDVEPVPAGIRRSRRPRRCACIGCAEILTRPIGRVARRGPRRRCTGGIAIFRRTATVAADPWISTA